MLLAAKRVNPQKLLTQFTSGHGWIWVVVVGVSVIALFAIIIKIRDWLRKSQIETSPEELLLAFRDIHRQGDLSANEYKAIRERLTKKSSEAGREGDAKGGPSAGDSVGGSPTAAE